LPGQAQTTNRVHRLGAAALFNGMIAPLTPMTLRGVIWYQGESNVGASPVEYAARLQMVIADWRARFGREDLPFGVVQLANFGEPWRDTKAAFVREAQAQVAAEVPNVGLAVAIDLGAVRIHPPDKRNVAERLARWARAKVYGETNLVFQSPRCQSCTVAYGKFRVQFDTGGPPLMLGKLDDRDVAREAIGQTLRGFELAGADGKFVPADAVIDGDSVVVSSPEVPARLQCVTLGRPIRRAATFTTGLGCRRRHSARMRMWGRANK